MQENDLTTASSFPLRSPLAVKSQTVHSEKSENSVENDVEEDEEEFRDEFYYRRHNEAASSSVRGWGRAGSFGVKSTGSTSRSPKRYS